MNPRIEKKLSKRLAQLLPKTFSDAWQLRNEPSEYAADCNSNITGCMCVGGGFNYWGERQDVYTVWDKWRSSYMWYADFDEYPCGHMFYGFPDTGNFKPTAINLIALAESLGEAK
ncbi:MAG: hypothetical protein ACN2B6_00265 [Rickettsiales bacterium]